MQEGVRGTGHNLCAHLGRLYTAQSTHLVRMSGVWNSSMLCYPCLSVFPVLIAAQKKVPQLGWSTSQQSILQQVALSEGNGHWKGGETQRQHSAEESRPVQDKTFGLKQWGRVTESREDFPKMENGKSGKSMGSKRECGAEFDRILWVKENIYICFSQCTSWLRSGKSSGGAWSENMQTES